jgi:DNA-binding NarL/FixJ family response regulator
MKTKSIGARGVKEVAEHMGTNQTYVVKATKNALRKLRWSNRLRAVKRFFDEYSKESS